MRVADGLSVAVGVGDFDAVTVYFSLGVMVEVRVRVLVSDGTIVTVKILGIIVKMMEASVGVRVSAFMEAAVAVRCLICSFKSILAHLVAIPAMEVLSMLTCLVCVAGAACVSVAFLTASDVAVARPEKAVRVL